MMGMMVQEVKRELTFQVSYQLLSQISGAQNPKHIKYIIFVYTQKDTVCESQFNSLSVSLKEERKQSCTCEVVHG